MLSHADNQGLLSYGIATSPDPLKASTQTGNATTAELVMTVSNLTRDPIHCRKILFSMPIGENADALTSSTEILCTASPSDKWQISGDGEGVFTATPVSPDDNQILAEGISFLFYGIEVNKQVGTFTLSIEEESSIDNVLFTLKSNAYDLTKFPSGFYFGNFASSAPMVDNGDTVTLTWTGSDLASYTIKYGTEQVQVTGVRTWTSPALTQNTTFELMATVLESGQSVNHYQYLTVIVDKPELESTTLTAKGTIQTEGDFVGLGIVPIGTVVPYAGGGPRLSENNGWLKCDGRSLSVDDYPDLFKAITHIYGTGDADDEFNLPDYRGMFLRGKDDGANLDPDKTDRYWQGDGESRVGDHVGSRQDDAFLKHHHSYYKSTNLGKGNGNWSGDYWDNEEAKTEFTGDNETRPKNVYVYFMIRAK